MLDMGEPFGSWIWRTVVRAQGVAARIEIAIEFSGLRPGEKLFEELALDFEQARTTESEDSHPWSS